MTADGARTSPTSPFDAVWDRIEQGAGQRIPRQGTQFGDTRCNRSALVLRAGGTLASLIDPDDLNHVDARDRLLAHFGGMYSAEPPAGSSQPKSSGPCSPTRLTSR